MRAARAMCLDKPAVKRVTRETALVNKPDERRLVKPAGNLTKRAADLYQQARLKVK